MQRAAPRHLLLAPLLCVLLLCLGPWACAPVKALRVRMEAEKLYKEGRTAEIIPLLEQALPELRADHGEESAYVAECLNGLGMAYGWVANDFQRSEEAFLEALRIREKVLGPAARETLQTRSFLGILYLVSGRLGRAVELLEAVVQAQEESLGGDHPDTAESRITLGQAYMMQGRYDEARTMFELGARHEHNQVSAMYPSPADGLASLGRLYALLGDYDAASRYLNETVRIKMRAFGENHSMVAQALDDLAVLALEHGDVEAARRYARKALEIKLAVFGQRHAFVADSYFFFAVLAMKENRLDEARSWLARAKAMYQEVMGPDSRRTLTTRAAELILALRLKDDDARLLGQCRDLLASPGLAEDQELYWLTHYMYGGLLERLGRVPAAIFSMKEAVRIIQGLRGAVSGFTTTQQQSFMVPRAQVYRHLASLLITQDRLGEAREVLSLLKHEEMAEFTRGKVVHLGREDEGVTFTLMEENWDRRYQEIQDHLVTLSREAASLRAKRRQGLSPGEEARLKALRQDLRLANTAYRRFLNDLEQELARAAPERIREISARNLDKLKAMQGALRDLGGRAVLVNYLETPDTLYVILTTAHVQVVRRVAVAAPDLNRLILAFRQELETPTGKPMDLARQLHGILFAPIAGDVAQSGAKVIMLSMDGPLRYLPAAALHDGHRFLVEDYALVLFTEASRARLLSPPPRQGLRFAGLGVTRAFPGFSPLPAVRDELDAIARTGNGDSGVMDGVILLDQDFTAETLFKVLDQGFPVLHIASHFVFRPGTEYDSFLLLGDGARFSLGDMDDQDMDFNDVEILTLSACETGLGGRGADGREVEGFGGLAQRRGAKTVLATLWPVADRSTARYMQDLYAGLIQDHASRAQALRQAQVEFIHSGEFSHPFYWAPFILMGNWL